MFLQRLTDEPRFAGSRFAPAGCAVYDTPGVYVWEWPEGVTRAIVTCIGGGGGGGVSTAGEGGGGGGAYSNSLVEKTDPTADINVGAGGTPGVNGGGSSFLQDSSVTEVCGAAGGNAASGRTGGLGGDASAGIGVIRFSGGDGGSSSQPSASGAGGGSSAGATEDGNNGEDTDGSSGAGLGGAAPDGGAPGADGGEFELGGNDGDSGTGGSGGGGGSASGGNAGNGGGGQVIICWEEPLPIGYCVETSGVRSWWPRCNYYCRGGTQCFYYGYYSAPDGPYFYPHGHPWPCCADEVYPALLTLTVSHIPGAGCESALAEQTQTLSATTVLFGGVYPTYRARLNEGWYIWVVLNGDANACQLYCSTNAAAPVDELVSSYLGVVSCDPLYASNGISMRTLLSCHGSCGPGSASTHMIIITE